MSLNKETKQEPIDFFLLVNLNISENFSISFSWMDSSLCIYHSSVSSKFCLFHNAQVIVFLPSCAYPVHLLVGWLIGWLGFMAYQPL